MVSFMKASCKLMCTKQGSKDCKRNKPSAKQTEFQKEL